MAVNNNIVYKLSAVDLMSATLRNINEQTEKLNRSVSKLGNTSSKSASKMASSFSYAKTALVALAAAGAYALTKNIMTAGQEVENATAGLTTILKSADDARQVITNSMLDAQKTPFSFGDIIKGNQLFISAGENIDKARESTLNLANALAAVGRANSQDFENLAVNLQTIRTSGKATAQDIKQFAIRGIDINGLMVDTYGKTLEQLKAQGPITADMLELAFKKASLAGGKYADGLKNSMNTVTGVISNIKDQFFVMAQSIFMDNKDLILDGLKALSETLTALVPVIKTGIGFIQDIVVYLTPIWGAIVNGFNRIKTAISGNSDLINDLLIFIDKLKDPIVTIINILGEAIADVINFLGWLNRTFHIIEGLGDAIVGIFNVVKPVWALIQDVFELVMAILEADWSTAWDKFVDGASDLWDALKAIWELLTGDNKTGGFRPGAGAGGSWGETVVDKVTKATTNKNNTSSTATPVTKGVSGPKITTINITMENMVKDITIQTTNMKESATAVTDIVTKALSQAIADSQLIIH